MSHIYTSVDTTINREPNPNDGKYSNTRWISDSRDIIYKHMGLPLHIFEAHTGNHLQLNNHTFSHSGTHLITVKEEQHSNV